jgi:ABC-type polysaccharide/polyol phosphate transport system ATPase subunit
VNIAIQFDAVSKKFILHHERARSFQELAVGLFQRNNRSREEFWALRDVSFAVEQGETVGIIGPNGAGKSTLLKLAARVIEPTSGRIAVRGRIGALLELGAGFHPDLTGRENIYLNGSILGLSRAEIRRRLDDIIGFAELERFIDVPVKHYSSGMYVRLGFSIAVHTDPEILLVDEVLAVGDQSFQFKCLQRIEKMRESGVSILFVSHNLDIVRRLCRQAIWLENGQVRLLGLSAQVIEEYLRSSMSQDIKTFAEGDIHGRGRRWGSGEVIITKVEFCKGDGQFSHVFKTGETFVARIHYRAFKPIFRPAFGVAIYRDDGLEISGPNTADSGFVIDAIYGEGVVEYIVERLPLAPGRYEFTAAIYDFHSVHPYDHQQRAYSFEVQPGSIPFRGGLVNIPCRWEHHRV